MPSTTGKMQQWQPRMPSWIASAVPVWNSDSTSEKRPPQYGQRRSSNVSLRMLGFAEKFEQRFAGRLERRAPELLDAEPSARFLFVDPRHRVVRAHLRAMAAERGELARGPVADVDDERRRVGAVAEGVGRDAPEARVRRRAAFRVRRFDDLL